MASLPGVGGYKTREGKKPARSCWLPPTTDQIGPRLVAKSKIAASGDDGSPAAHPGPSAQRTRQRNLLLPVPGGAREKQATAVTRVSTRRRKKA
jgi:hypothetical protein